MQKLLLTVIMAVAVLRPAVCRAEVKCPWLNAATVEGLLGEKVQMDIVPPTAQGDAICTFNTQQNSAGSILRIVVHTLDNPSKDFASYVSQQCDGTTIALKAIGNEAVQCVPKGSNRTSSEKIIARVRERAFILTVHRGAPTHPGEELPEDTRNIAEQVAGSLF